MMVSGGLWLCGGFAEEFGRMEIEVLRYFRSDIAEEVCEMEGFQLWWRFTMMLVVVCNGDMLCVSRFRGVLKCWVWLRLFEYEVEWFAI